MLASLLPGVRDLRTPLAVGATLMIAVWVAFGERIPRPEEAKGLLARIYEIASVVGVPSMLALGAFVAYLLGSAWAYTVDAPVRRVRLNVGRSATSLRLLESFLGKDRTLENLGRSQVFDLARELMIGVPTLRWSLLIANKDLYDQFDRKESEAELRIAISAPMAILVIVTAFESSLWVLPALVFVALLLVQGLSQSRDADLILAQAVVQRVIVPPRLDEARRSAKALEEAAEARRNSVENLRSPFGSVSAE